MKISETKDVGMPTPLLAMKVVGSIVVHMLVGIVLFTVWRFAYFGKIEKFQMHFLLSTIGYQLLMVEAVLTFNGDYALSHLLSREHKKKVHMVMMIIGGIFAIAGASIAIYIFGGKFSGAHGICGLIALIFSLMSLCNGGLAFFAPRLRHAMKPSLAKLLHTVSGVFALVMGLVTLCLGVNTETFVLVNGKKISICMTVFIVFILLYTLITPLLSIKRYSNSLRSAS